MKKFTFLALIGFNLFATSSCDILRQAINTPTNPSRPTTVYTCVPMTDAEFQRSYDNIKERRFEDDRLTIAKQRTQQGQCLTSFQIKQIAQLFKFEDSRLEYTKYSYNYCADKNNYGIMNDMFKFDSSKEELNRVTGVN
jgi:Domain of unknown function (DUF4476)